MPGNTFLVLTNRSPFILLNIRYLRWPPVFDCFNNIKYFLGKLQALNFYYFPGLFYSLRSLFKRCLCYSAGWPCATRSTLTAGGCLVLTVLRSSATSMLALTV